MGWRLFSRSGKPGERWPLQLRQQRVGGDCPLGLTSFENGGDSFDRTKAEVRADDQRSGFLEMMRAGGGDSVVDYQYVMTIFDVLLLDTSTLSPGTPVG